MGHILLFLQNYAASKGQNIEVVLQLYSFWVEGNGRPWNFKEGKAKKWQESNVGRVKIALIREKVKVLSVLSTCRCLVVFLP